MKQQTFLVFKWIKEIFFIYSSPKLCSKLIIIYMNWVECQHIHRLMHRRGIIYFISNLTERSNSMKYCANC